LLSSFSKCWLYFFLFDKFLKKQNRLKINLDG
jgi:hypothetical protein